MTRVQVTREAGFGPSCVTLAIFYAFSAATGLYITEVNINTVCELGSGAVSLKVFQHDAERLSHFTHHGLLTLLLSLHCTFFNFFAADQLFYTV
jgi:hypothetical protein